MSVISNFIVISLFLNELSSNLILEFKIIIKDICKHFYSLLSFAELLCSVLAYFIGPVCGINNDVNNCRIV